MELDEIPAKYRANIDVADAPFDRKPGEKPAITNREIRDIIAFVETPDDGCARSLIGAYPYLSLRAQSWISLCAAAPIPRMIAQLSSARFFQRKENIS